MKQLTIIIILILCLSCKKESSLENNQAAGFSNSKYAKIATHQPKQVRELALNIAHIKFEEWKKADPKFPDVTLPKEAFVLKTDSYKIDKNQFTLHITNLELSEAALASLKEVDYLNDRHIHVYIVEKGNEFVDIATRTDSYPFKVETIEDNNEQFRVIDVNGGSVTFEIN